MRMSGTVQTSVKENQELAVCSLEGLRSDEYDFSGRVVDYSSGKIIVRIHDSSDVSTINVSPQTGMIRVLINSACSQDIEEYHLAGIIDAEKEEILYKEDLNEGMIAVDTDAPHWSDDPRVKIENITTQSANSVQPSNDSETVAEKNPSFPKEDPVIEASYISGGDKSYSFPKSRLSVKLP